MLHILDPDRAPRERCGVMARRLCILVVDDDVDNARSLAELFELEGHQADVAYSGEAAIGAFAARQYDIAFLDVLLPGRNGVESFLEIKRQNGAARAYMMTGYSVEQLLQQAVSGGVRGVLRKPYTVDKLLAILRDTSPAGLVLVAEDDPALGRHLAGLVSQAGYATALVTDGGTALATVEDRRIHVLVLDLRLPLIDGVGVYKELEAANRAVPTIIITGRGSGRSTRLAALDDVAVTGILNKPFDPALLLERLETLAA